MATHIPIRVTVLVSLLASLIVAQAYAVEEKDARLDVWENDNKGKPAGPTFYKHPGPGRQYSGSYKDLDDKEIEWNDKIRSVVLYGPSGTTVWLYDSKNFKDNDDILEIMIPEGQSSVVINQLNEGHPKGVRWVKKKNGIAGKVSGIQWK